MLQALAKWDTVNNLLLLLKCTEQYCNHWKCALQKLLIVFIIIKLILNGGDSVGLGLIGTVSAQLFGISVLYSWRSAGLTKNKTTKTGVKKTP